DADARCAGELRQPRRPERPGDDRSGRATGGRVHVGARARRALHPRVGAAHPGGLRAALDPDLPADGPALRCPKPPSHGEGPICAPGIGPWPCLGIGQDGVMDEIEAFWQRAQQHAELATVSSYMGVNPIAALRPPAWGFGATPEQADELLD